MRKRAGGGDGEYAGAAAEVEHARDPTTAGYTVERFEAERGGGVVPGAEGLAGLDLDGAATAAGAVAVVAAVHEEAACNHRRQGRLR